MNLDDIHPDAIDRAYEAVENDETGVSVCITCSAELVEPTDLDPQGLRCPNCGERTVYLAETILDGL
jgi:DNA-directed RNA polymerase subunit RPC12/RpoP